MLIWSLNRAKWRACLEDDIKCRRWQSKNVGLPWEDAGLSPHGLVYTHTWSSSPLRTGFQTGFPRPAAGQLPASLISWYCISINKFRDFPFFILQAGAVTDSVGKKKVAPLRLRNEQYSQTISLNLVRLVGSDVKMKIVIKPSSGPIHLAGPVP